MKRLAFAEKLSEGSMLVTVELSPPKGTDMGFVLKVAKGLVGKVDAINVPDCQLSMLKMSSMATSKIIQDETGIEAIWQLTCRDRNLIALQADILGAYALGLRNILALTGDPVQIGDQAALAKQVFHLESVRLLKVLQQLNQDMDACEKPLDKQGTRFVVGAAINPFKLSSRAQQNRLAQKIERQPDFFQTQPVYHASTIKETIEQVALAADQTGYPPPRVLAGIIPPKSAEAARRMNQTIVGINIPETLITLLERADDPVKESMLFCADLIEELKPFVDGFHFMPVGTASKIHLLLDRCQLRQPVG
jgi:methylenetetrahydrofolate reductase (NADPH)